MHAAADWTADCVKCVFLSGEREGEREWGRDDVCAEFPAKQMFISISECSCEAIRLHYQEHTNYVGAWLTEGKHATHTHTHTHAYTHTLLHSHLHTLKYCQSCEMF